MPILVNIDVDRINFCYILNFWYFLYLLLITKCNYESSVHKIKMITMSIEDLVLYRLSFSVGVDFFYL